MGIGGQELLLILLIVIILFGAKKIPELAKGLGTGLREFRKAAQEIELDDVKSAPVSESTKAKIISPDDDQSSQ